MTGVVGVVAVRTDHFPGWHAHPDVWALVAGAALLYWSALRRERSRRALPAPPASALQRASFGAGLAVILVASDWPVHDLAEHYLYSVHMFQHMLFTLVAPPLLLLGTPAWMARRLLRPPGLFRAVRAVGRPVPGIIQFNVVLVVSHWPVWVDLTLRHHELHFVAHAVLVVSALLMWLPVVSPLPEVPRARPPTQMLYLFIQTIVPTVPASFLTFGSSPLYHFYEHVPRLYGISALTDQQAAGLLMKIGGGFFLWTVIGIIFFRWYAREEAQLPAVLTWEDVERELHQLG